MRRRRSRLTSIERKRTVKAVAWALFFVAALGGALFYFGIPLLIRMAVFMASVKKTDSIEVESSALIASPVLDALPEATPSAMIRASGFSLPGLTVIVTVNGSELPPTIAADDGSFAVSADLVSGDNIIAAYARNANNQSSRPSSSWTVVRDSSPPELTVSVSDGKLERTGEGEKTAIIQGETDAASVTVNGRFVSLSSGGSFSDTVTLNDGENQIRVVATDKAGNSSEETLTIRWTPS